MIELKVKAVSPLMGTKFPLPAYATAGAAPAAGIPDNQPSCSLLFLVRDAPFSTLSIPYRAGPARGKTRKNPLPVPAKSTGRFCTLLRRCVQNLRQMLASSIANVLYWSEIKRQGGFHDGIYSETDL